MIMKNHSVLLLFLPPAKTSFDQETSTIDVNMNNIPAMVMIFSVALKNITLKITGMRNDDL
jgi:hypothetical protein